MPDLVIDDATPIDAPALTDGTTGLVQRPPGTVVSASPFTMKLVPRAEWPERIRDRVASGRTMEAKIRAAGIKSKNQNDPKYMNTRNPRWGYCWMYGLVGCMEVVRVLQNLPHVPLSAFGAAWTVKNGADEGGWGALALDFAMSRGIPTEADWPNFDARQHEAAWANAAKFKVAEAWVDLSSPVYDRDMTLDQKFTALFNYSPVDNDYMWWGHNVYSCDPVDCDPHLDLMDPNRWGSKDRNSWGDSYGDQGFFTVRGNRCVPDNAVSPTSINPVWS